MRSWHQSASIATIGVLFALLETTAWAQAEAITDDDGGDDLDVTAAYEQMALAELVNVKVVTASRLEESVRDAPVPVTVITSDMIRASGARNLSELLQLYVPGMTLVTDHNEMNVAMRGIYTSAQQKILILLDGHRLNSRAYSMAAPDYSIGIDLARIKQIEVLRGPGSSLYGNVALTAVINIISKSGGQVDGASVTVRAGDYVSRGDTNPLMSDSPTTVKQRPFAAGQTASMTFGHALGEDSDVLFWGSFFTSNGQVVPIAPEEDYSPNPQGGIAVLGGARDPGSYDVGIKYRAGRLRVLGNVQQGKVIEPFSAGGMTGEAFDYDQYRPFQGIGPGLSSRSAHLEAKYDIQATESFNVEATGYVDQNDLGVVLVIAPATTTYGYVAWRDYAVGSVLQSRADYDFGAAGAGNLTTGLQVDHMELFDSNFLIGTGGDWSMGGDMADEQVLEPGNETIYSAFAQLKHRLSSSLLFNVGVRTDIKDRHKGENLTDISPRLAAVWAPAKEFDVKVSYAESFVDAPYWYRYNALASYQGSEGLTPEHLRSVQVTPSVRFLGGLLQNSVNLFYNHVFDFVFRDPDGATTGINYTNAGSLQSLGVENEFAYLRATHRVRANFTYQRAIKARDFGADTDTGQIHNVPSLVGNFIVDGQPLAGIYDNLLLSGSIRYIGGQLAPIGPTFRINGTGMAEEFVDPDNELDQYLLLNAGAEIADAGLPGLDVALHVDNILDTRFWQGGTTLHPYPQPGRTIFATLRYHFKP